MVRQGNWQKQLQNCKIFAEKIINNMKNLHFEGKIADNNNNPKERWRTLKSLGMPFKGRKQSKILLKRNVVSFNWNQVYQKLL